MDDNDSWVIENGDILKPFPESSLSLDESIESASNIINNIASYSTHGKSPSMPGGSNDAPVRAEGLIPGGEIPQLATTDMHIEDNLCTMCRELLSWSYLQYEQAYYLSKVFHPHFLENVAAAHQGCALCATLVGLVLHHDGRAVTSLPSFENGVWKEEDDEEEDGASRYQLRFRVPAGYEPGKPGVGTTWTVHVFICPLDRPTNGGAIRGEGTLRGSLDEVPEMVEKLYSLTLRPLSTHAANQVLKLCPATFDIHGLSSERLLHLAKGWLAKCLQHPACSQRSMEADFTMPTRLINIRLNPIRLCSSIIRSGTRYATLSHCWGTDSKTLLKLTKTTKAAFHSEIPLHALSRTFKDAIRIALELGLDYLWIDSLCIVQDDEQDWRMEAAMMQHVYGNSFINIAASDAVDGSYGCFLDRKKPFQTFHTTRVKVKVGEVDMSYDCTPAVVSGCLANSVLSSRGWCLQERLLAPRTLHFCSTQLFWECNTTLSCECFPEGVPEDFGGKGTWPPNVNEPLLIDKSRLMHHWPTILKLYSKCKLTRPADKLIALAGIIRRIEVEESDTCYAGIWKRTFETGLLWHMRSFVPSTEYCAPSWSWASRQGELIPVVDHRALGFSDPPAIAHLLDVSLDPVGEDTKGELRGGQLRMICQTLIEGQRIQNKIWDPQSFGTYRNGLHPDREMIVVIKTTQIPIEVVCFWDGAPPPFGTTIFLLPILASMFGLVLASSASGTSLPGQYRRLGCFRPPNVPEGSLSTRQVSAHRLLDRCVPGTRERV